MLACHNFLRSKNDIAAVSLRDVRRVANLVPYYLRKLQHQSDSCLPEEQEHTQALLLKAFYVAICLCYWFRLKSEQRTALLKEIENELCRVWTGERIRLDDGRWRVKAWPGFRAFGF